MNVTYTEHHEKRVLYLMRKISELPTGHTISPAHLEGYPFTSFVDQYGRYLLTGQKLEQNYLYKYLKQNKHIMRSVDLIEVAWKYYLIYGTPNGDMFKHNADFENLSLGRGLPLVHITTHLEEIKRTGRIYQSMGCLGASIYCTPLRRDYRLHNLGRYISNVEFPNYFASHPDEKSKLDYIVIWLDNENFLESSPLFSGIDYLYMGQLQLKLYKQFKSIYFDEYHDEFIGIEMEVIKEIKKNIQLFELCQTYKLDDVSDAKFIKIFDKSIKDMPVLGYVYFEVLSEYISLFQNDYDSMVLHELGELNNFNYKNLVYDIEPKLKQGFKLSKFNPNLELVTNYLQDKAKKGQVITDFLRDHFIHFFKWRFSQYIRSRFLDGMNLPSVLTFTNIEGNNPSLIGHITHRKLREHLSIREKAYVYDMFRAKTYWNHWNTTNVAIPYNAIIPKGEVGINPIFKDLSYKVYQCSLNNKSNTIDIVQQLNAVIEPSLVGNKFNLLRKHKE